MKREESYTMKLKKASQTARLPDSKEECRELINEMQKGVQRIADNLVKSADSVTAENEVYAEYEIRINTMLDSLTKYFLETKNIRSTFFAGIDSDYCRIEKAGDIADYVRRSLYCDDMEKLIFKSLDRCIFSYDEENETVCIDYYSYMNHGNSFVRADVYAADLDDIARTEKIIKQCMIPESGQSLDELEDGQHREKRSRMFWNFLELDEELIPAEIWEQLFPAEKK